MSGQSSILDHFSINLFSCSREQAMYSYIKVITMLSLPVSNVENSNFREFSKHNEVLPIKLLKETIFSLHEIVEIEIRKEMVDTRGALTRDGRTRNGTYYFGVIAPYMKSIQRISGGELITEQTLALPLLSALPLAHRDEDGNVIDSKAIARNIEIHISHLEDVLTYNHLNVHLWTSCIIGESFNLNLRIARSMELPHVGCSTQKWNLEVLKL